MTKTACDCMGLKVLTGKKIFLLKIVRKSQLQRINLYDPTLNKVWSMRDFPSDETGNITVVFAMFLPIIVAAAAMAIDYSNTLRYQMLLQNAADAAALTSAKELISLSAMKGVDVDKELDRVAQTVVDVQLTTTQRPAESNATMLSEDIVRVHAWREVKPVLGELYGAKTMLAEAYATARAYGGDDLCMLVTEEDDRKHVLYLQNDAIVEADGCLLHSNAKDGHSVDLKNHAVLRAGTVCSAGGITIHDKGLIEGNTISDCPVLTDPLGAQGCGERSDRLHDEYARMFGFNET